MIVASDTVRTALFLDTVMATAEFFRLVRDRLAPGSWSSSTSATPRRRPHRRTLSATMRSAFGTVLRNRSQSVNTLLLGTNTRPRHGCALRHPRCPAPGPTAAAAGHLDRLTGGGVFTDNITPVSD